MSDPDARIGHEPAEPHVTRGRAVAAAVPVVLVNAVALAGQFAFLRAHLPWPVAGQVMMAVALESVAIYLAYNAHAAQLANDSALRLRLASYGFAAVIGAMNYSHYAAPGWRPTFAAVAVGLMSASSPWLWAVHSRRASRDALLASGQIEPHALRLGPTRWLWHPIRSGRVMFMATWEGVTEPREAVTKWEAQARPVAPAAARQTRAALPPGGATDGATETATGRRVKRDRRGATRKRQTRRSQADMEAQALAELSRQPGISGADLGRAIGASPRTGQRLLAQLAGVASGDQNTST